MTSRYDSPARDESKPKLIGRPHQQVLVVHGAEPALLKHFDAGGGRIADGFDTPKRESIGRIDLEGDIFSAEGEALIEPELVGGASDHRAKVESRHGFRL